MIPDSEVLSLCQGHRAWYWEAAGQLSAYWQVLLMDEDHVVEATQVVMARYPVNQGGCDFLFASLP